MNTISIELEWFPERGGGLDRYYHDCYQYLSQIGTEVTGLLVGSNKASVESEGIVKAFASPEDSLIRRWMKMRKVFNQTFNNNQYELIVTHFALHSFSILN